IANHINDYTLKEWTDVSTFTKTGSAVPAKETTSVKTGNGGGCLIATATYGSEMSQQVQQLRELRDNQLLQTESGTAFMGTFNDVYYSFSPIIADMERENPYFKEAVKLAITPMISSLSLMENAETESEVLSLGISVITLNLAMYLGVPAIVVVGIRKQF
ncbi:MAG: peptidylprolyl isomerase, partial [Nitrosopumilaceae archaeon]|nr:peptidylprolyl isomerase [Nitrosopumilaceae archaeon]